jgi:hypothetical protein
MGEIVSNIIIAFDVAGIFGICVFLLLIIINANRPGGYRLTWGRKSTQPNKTLITLEIDDDLLNEFRAKARATGQNYKELMIGVMRKTLALD